MLQRLRVAAETGSPNLIDELLNQVAKGFGIDSHLLREAVNPTIASTKEVELSEANIEDIRPQQTTPSEPVESITAGRTFMATAEPVRQLEAGDDLESLGGELDRELEALMSEGTSIFGEAEGRITPPAMPQEPAVEAAPSEAPKIAAQSLEVESAENQAGELGTASDELGDVRLSNSIANLPCFKPKAPLLSASGAQNLALKQEETSEAGTSGIPGSTHTSEVEDLSDLESELDSEIAALEADGLTFHAESSAEAEVVLCEAPVEPTKIAAPAPLDEEIASLEQALD